MEDGCQTACQMLAGCSFCCLWIAWWVCGGLALSYTYDDAEGCGWWMWIVFLVELIYVPFAILPGGAYTAAAGAALCCASKEETDMGNACANGCVRGFLFLVLNLLSGLVLGFVGKGIWGEDCIPTDTWLHVMAMTGFVICSIITGVNIILSALEFVRASCGESQVQHA